MESSMDVKAVQTALKKGGFNPGPIDGVWGRRTIAALMAFQNSKGLASSDVVDADTSKALLGRAGSTDSGISAPHLVWYEEALRQLGTKEEPGPASNPKIIQWAGKLGIRYAGDDIPWCGLFVAHCVGATLPAEPLPNNPLGARNWSTFGRESEPTLGAILVFWRESKASEKGHVGFYHGEDGAAFQVLGGNQSNQVSIARISKDRLLVARQPATTPPLLGGATYRSTAGEQLSKNEA
jgi:uncharacterized protein (TIGR02594 family)